MVHNGIEYGQMAALAEGLALLRAADHSSQRYDLDLAQITELWRRGSVIGSWLLDLTAGVLRTDPALAGFTSRVADSGEGRWTVQAAVEAGVPAYVLTAALYARFGSRGESEFGDKALSAMRHAFGGHCAEVADHPDDEAGQRNSIGGVTSERRPPSESVS